MRIINLTQGAVVFVDDEDFETLKYHKWYLHADGYAARQVNNRAVFMHNVIMNCSLKRCVDHTDRNRLNNQRSNLRFISRSANAQNRNDSRNKSGFHGVYWHKGVEKWCAQIKQDGIVYHLGYFRVKEEAAHQYDKVAIRMYGPRAKTNFPQPITNFTKIVNEVSLKNNFGFEGVLPADDLVKKIRER